jgi:outer membrane phospholipase A
MKRFVAFVFFFSLLTPILRAQSEALLIPPTEPVLAGRELRLKLYLNNPASEAATYELPSHLEVALANAAGNRVMSAKRVASSDRVTVDPMSFTTVEVAVEIPESASGVVSLRLIDPRTNPVMFLVTPAPVAAKPAAPVQSPAAATAVQSTSLDLASEREEMRRYISAYDPIYFAVGPRGGTNAKFQFSFKYRVFAPSGNVSEWWRDLYFSYTQTSLWDLTSLSKPFYDTSYKPALFYLHESFAWRPSWLDRLGLQAGAQHESNGKAGNDSRSVNTAFITPQFGTSIGSWKLVAAPRFIVYLEDSENRALASYRGYVELMVRLGQDRGFQLISTFRPGSGSHLGAGSLEFDATWPLNKVPFFSPAIGGYLLVQWFTGNGESLLSYDRRGPDQLRLGLMIVR